ncbi:MAG: DUF3373 domain-containing protein [Sulfurovum sp.]|nr:MAG: DUF3373 domain-containing protein [Sulfurovum sp.]
MKSSLSIILSSLLYSSLFAIADEEVNASINSKPLSSEERIGQLEKQLSELKTEIASNSETLTEVKKHDAFDNIKFSLDFRNTYDILDYKYKKYSYTDATGTHDMSGQSASNDGLFTSRLYLNMKSSPVENLIFSGQVAMYGVWGGESFGDAEIASKGWNNSSKADDTLFRLRQAYVIYNDSMLDEKLPYTLSIGRRQSTDGFLANHREGMKEAGSPLGHITNMEVDGIMGKLDLENYFLPGSFLKLVYGRAHTGGIETLYDSRGGYQPYAQAEGDANENVDYLVALGSLYNNGQYNLMFENATIFDTKGKNSTTNATAVGAGTANLSALSLQSDGIGEDLGDFADDTIAFGSVAMTHYKPSSGHQLLGSSDATKGYSYWAGVVFPDMITEKGKFGLEYNHGSKYWTPMTWAEDTAMGSKVAVRGNALEGYWNFNMFGLENLTGQARYTYAQHDYTPSIRCSGWVAPQEVDIEASDLRLFVKYIY